MIKRSCYFFCAIFSLACNHNSSASNQDRHDKRIKCRLVAAPTTHIHCGILAVTVAMKFELAAMNDTIPSCFIGMINCPDDSGDGFFKAQAVYSVILKDTAGNVHDVVINPYDKEKYRFFYLDSLKRELSE